MAKNSGGDLCKKQQGHPIRETDVVQIFRTGTMTILVLGRTLMGRKPVKGEHGDLQPPRPSSPPGISSIIFGKLVGLNSDVGGSHNPHPG